MRTRVEIIDRLGEAKRRLASRYGIRKLALFGSYAREDQTAQSDVDVLVEVDPSIGLDFVILADEIESIVGEPVELVSRGAVKPRNMSVIEPDLIYV